jgi:hypothetical protein
MPSVTLSSGGVLTVTTGAGTNTVTLDTAAGGVTATLNGVKSLFMPGKVHAIIVQEGSGTDTINVERTLSSAAVTIHEGTGSDTVNISPTAHNLNNIQGNVFVVGNSIFKNTPDTLTIDDQANSASANWTTTAFSATRNGAALISYNSLTQGGNDVININGGSGTNTYNNTQTWYTTWLNTGSGADTVNVQGNEAELHVIGQGSHDTVNVGNAGSLQSVWGITTIEHSEGSLGHIVINVDDSADSTPVTDLSLETVTPPGDGPFGFIGYATATSGGNIYYEYADTSSLTFRLGHNATVNVLATGVTTNLIGTTGGAMVNVGHDPDVPGLHSVQGILGTLNIENPVARNMISIDDSADTANHTATVKTFTPLGDSAWATVTGLGPAPINYECADTLAVTVLTGPHTTTNVQNTGGVPTSINGVWH